MPLDLLVKQVLQVLQVQLLDPLVPLELPLPLLVRLVLKEKLVLRVQLEQRESLVIRVPQVPQELRVLHRQSQVLLEQRVLPLQLLALQVQLVPKA